MAFKPTYSSGIDFYTAKQPCTRHDGLPRPPERRVRSCGDDANRRGCGATSSQTKLQFLQFDLASLHATRATMEKFPRREEGLDFLSAPRFSFSLPIAFLFSNFFG